MKYRYARNTFVRHACDESVVWCPRTGGCTVMRNAQVILLSVPICVARANKHRTVHDGKDMNFVANM